MADLAKRFPKNPLLRPADIQPSIAGMQVECLLNPGVFHFDGKIWLLLRVAERPQQSSGKLSFPVIDADSSIRIVELDTASPGLDLSDPRIIRYQGEDYLTTLSYLKLVSSSDGMHFHEEPEYPAIVGRGEMESYGIEDCRVVQIDNIYHLTYTAVSPHGVGVGHASTTDWKSIHRHGMMLPPHNKDCALFAEKIDGRYYALHRPSSVQIGGNYLWLAESPDLLHWGHHRCLAHTRPGAWDSVRVGAGAAPIRTPQGWLEIYHGANEQHRYCLGALLLDLQKPWQVLARSTTPIMEPTATYEQEGFFGNVVFTNGHLVNGDQLTLYYGASDSVICGAQFSITEILRSLR